MSRYHLTRKDREISSEGDKEEILRSARYASIAMQGYDGPYIVTMSHGYDPGRRSLFFHCAPTGHKLEMIAGEPCVCATVIDDLGYVEGRCEHRYRSLVIRGRIRVVDDLGLKKHGIEVLMRHQESDPDPVRERNLKTDADYENFVILEMKIEDITGKQSL